MRVVKNADLLIVNAGELLCIFDTGEPRAGKMMSLVNGVDIIKNGALAIKDGKIADVGPTARIGGEWHSNRIFDVQGKVVMPGFVDCHTHLVFAGSREDEFVQKIQGVDYLEILRRGGGILDTVRKTRAASVEDLLVGARKRLDQCLRHGTTTVEIKSGYGLSMAEERKILGVINRLKKECVLKLDIVPTFLGAHVFPPETPREEYLREISVMAATFSEENLAVFCDIFCERGAFRVDDVGGIFTNVGLYTGLKKKIHAGQFYDIGGVKLALEHGVTSIDHLDFVSDKDIKMMAQCKTVGVLLPSVSFHLMIDHYAPARKMIKAGAPIALATDFNPGSSPTLSMQMVLALAVRQMKMTPAEAIIASTVNAAHAIDMADKVGSFNIGKQADIIILDIANHQELPYWFGTNLVRTVFKKGEIVCVNQRDVQC